MRNNCGHLFVLLHNDRAKIAPGTTQRELSWVPFNKYISSILPLLHDVFPPCRPCPRRARNADLGDGKSGCSPISSTTTGLVGGYNAREMWRIWSAGYNSLGSEIGVADLSSRNQ